MFEKEAEFYAREKYSPKTDDFIVAVADDAFRDGAKFGYNKANEWHYVKDGDLPKESGIYFVAIPNENGFIETDVARFGVSCGWEYFDTFVDEYGREHIIAWKEYPTFL